MIYKLIMTKLIMTPLRIYKQPNDLARKSKLAARMALPALHSEPRYSVRANDDECLMVREVGYSDDTSGETGIIKVRAILSKEVWFVDHTYATRKEAEDSL